MHSSEVITPALKARRGSSRIKGKTGTESAMLSTIKAEPCTAYNAFEALSPDEWAVVKAARAVLRAHLSTPGPAVSGATSARALVELHLAGYGHECFAVLLFDQQHRLIAFEEMFHGTINQVAVYPREIARLALKKNAAAVILAHNHPSGHPMPSEADRGLTSKVQQALQLLDIEVLDHFVVSASETVSFAEMGLMGAQAPRPEPSSANGRKRRQ